MTLNQLGIFIIALLTVVIVARWGNLIGTKEEKIMGSFFDLLKSKGFIKTVLLLVIAIVFGVNITPVVRLATLSTPPTPTILGMTLSDFLTWLVSSGVIGVVLAAALAKMSFIPAKFAEFLVPVLSAAFGAAVTAAIPFIAPALLDKTVFEIILMVASGVVTWVFALLGSHQVAAILISGDFKGSERTLKIAGVALVLLLALGLAATFAPMPASAETVAQMRVRVNAELRTQYAAVLNSWNGNQPCARACIDNWVAHGNDWLIPGAQFVGLPLDDFVLGAIAFSAQQGDNFRSLYISRLGREPTKAEWEDFWQNPANYETRNQAYLDLYNTSPRLDKWIGDRAYHRKQEYNNGRE